MFDSFVKNYFGILLLAKLHANATVHAIFEELQLCQYGFPSTRLDFRNAVQSNFPMFILRFPLYFESNAAINQILR